MKNSFAFKKLSEYAYDIVNAYSTPLTNVESAISHIERNKSENISFLKRNDISDFQRVRENEILKARDEAIIFLQTYGKIDEWDYIGELKK